jgi:hypothetical protein
MTRQLGLRPPSNKPALMLAPALTGAVPAHPQGADHYSRVSNWFLGSNDRFGTCGPTSIANYLRVVFKYLLGEDVTVTDQAIFDLYRRSGNPRFNPATGADDNGVDMQTMLEAFAKGGIQVVRGNGTTEMVKPVCFAKAPATNLDDIRAVISIFGGILFGLDLETAQDAQTDQRPPIWDYRKSPSWGGHAVVGVGYTSAPAGVDIRDVSWAKVVGTTDMFVTRQTGEAWVAVLQQHLDHPAFQEGVDLSALAADYTALTGRPFPVAPTPSPVPMPTPSVDPDRQLLINLGPWMAAPHAGDNAAAVRYVQQWAEAKHL